MIKYHIENGVYICHLDVDGWSSDKYRECFKEAKRLAALEDYPTIWVQVYPEKARFMEHLGLTFIRNRLTEDGIIKIYCLDTGVFKNADN